MLCTQGAVKAQEISIEEAEKIALDFFSSRTSAAKKSAATIKSTTLDEPTVTMAYAPDCEATGNTAFYLFNRTAEEEVGFVIVSGDNGDVLGYCDNNAFDYDTAPEGVKSLLNMLANNRASSAKMTSTYATALPTSVDPLLKSQWNQLAPYNLMCPSNGSDNAVTGCGATCISQIAYYYRFPVVGSGSNSYVSSTNGFSCSYDFSKAAFDYDNMTDTYDSNSTAAQKNAVAELMYAAGVAVNMDYKVYPYSSTCTLRNIEAGLRNYFRYDAGMSICYMENYTLDGWKEMLCTEVSEGRPVVYQGIGKKLGHVFMLDGYNTDMLFHINWGWGGSYDGYYDVGNLSVGDYGALNTYLWVIKGIKPSASDPVAEAYALLKSKATEALDSCGQSSKLITSSSQFSSPYTEAKEGSIYNLIDGNQASFWHSAWNAGAVANGVHYIEIALPEGTIGDIIMNFGRRSDTNGHHLTKARIEGVVSGSGTEAVTESIAELDLPYKEQTETVTARFNMPKAYSSIRLVELATTGGSGFFHIGELQFYTIAPYYAIEDAFDEADALTAAMKATPSEATEEDLNTLQKAYDEFMFKVFGNEPDDTYYPVVFDKSLNYTHGTRRLNGIVLNGSADGNKTINVPNVSKIYNKVHDSYFSAMPGESVTPRFNFTTDWMNGFVYIDCDQNGSFEATLNSDGSIPAGSDIMAFSYSEPKIGSGVGYNSTGASVSGANVLNPPAFTIPATLAPGYYTMRYKVDWVSIDPAGRAEDGNGIIKNGGAICDVRINIHNAEGTLKVIAENGSLLAADGSALPANIPFGKAVEIKAAPNEGYILDVLRVRHGHNLDGAANICGTQQYEELYLAAPTANGGMITLPAEYIDGDVEIEAFYVLAPAEDEGEGYAVSFDKETTTGDDYNATITVTTGAVNNVFTVEGNSVYKDYTDYPIMLNAPKSLALSVDDERNDLNYYLYVDINNDGKFTPLLKADGTPAYSSELISFTYYNGKDSKGNAVAAPGKSLPRYTLPTNLPDGIYRARLKADVNNISPAGSADITTKGGAVIDFLLNIVEGNYKLDLNTINGGIIGAGNSALPVEIAPQSEIQFALLAGAPGFEAKEIVVRHGHNIDGEQFINGNKQWSEEIIDATDGVIIMPREYVDGEVQLFAEFVKNNDSEWHLVFSDEFNATDGTQPESEWWSRCTRMNATWNRWLSDSEEVIYIEDGKLVARAIPNPDTTSDNVPMITGGIWSRGKFGFTYGRIEGRIKTNPWRGNFPAFWLMPEDQSGGWPNDGEIDIWEAIDSQEDAWHTVHSNWTYNLKQTNNPKSSFKEYTAIDRYHIYTLEWDETSLVWYVDGKQVAQYYKSSSQDALDKGQWPFDDHFHIILNQSVGNGSWAANADVTHTYVTLFDWVRVYQKNDMENTNGTVGIVLVEERKPAKVNCIDGGVIVSVASPKNVMVFDIVGRKVAEAYVEDCHTFRLPAGIYLIDGNKVLVK